ncbi:MAG: response regulator [Planctomycetia bacterium]|nr:response regulator [Planctomycetia bacterium]
MPPASLSDHALNVPRASILLVDDQPANLLALEVLLEDLGHVLVRASSGEEALRLVQASEFALILLDVRMPGLDGFQTARLIRGQEPARRTPIIFVSAAESDDFPVLDAYKLGAVDYLIKPLLPGIVRAKVNSLVELYQEKEQAKKQREQFRLLVQSAADYAIFMLDPKGCVATWNTGAERINGYTAEEIIGRHFSTFYPQEALDRGWPAEELRRAAALGRFEDEGWRVRKDGSLLWANVIITALRDARGQLRGFSKITRDLTERKRAEESLRHAHAVLEDRVKARTAELAQANADLQAEIVERQRLEEELRRRLDQLAEADRHKNEFLAMLAHELRNPLAPVRNALHILKMPGADRDTAEQARGLMERQVQHLVRLVDDLLDVSRIVRGQIELRREPVELMTVVGRAVETAQPALDAHGHQLSVSLPPHPVYLDADLVRLAQVLGNLLINAAKYTPRAGRIQLSAETNADEVTLRVRDSGNGIAPELLPRVFDLFVQADRSLARSQGGLGIGLTLVKRIAEMHGGRVAAASAGPGQGSEFSVTLPILHQTPAVPERALSASSGPLRRRVLVVDDNVDAAESAATLLRLRGHEVRTVHDGLSVLAVARDFRPEVILLDIGLPGMTGYEVARQLRAQTEFAPLLLAAMTGYGQDEDKRLSHEAGFDLHLTKPLDPAKLEEVVSGPPAP